MKTILDPVRNRAHACAPKGPRGELFLNGVDILFAIGLLVILLRVLMGPYSVPGIYGYALYTFFSWDRNHEFSHMGN